MGLAHFFNAKSIAVIGASSDPLRIGGRPVAALKRNWLPQEAERRLYPVNPSRKKVQGLKAYSTAQSIGETVDLAIIAVPATRVSDSLRDCAAAGCQAAIVFSAGFGETGTEGSTREDDLIALARDLRIRLLGPNCLGLLDLQQGLMATFTDAVNYDGHLPGSVGIASQSGAVMSQLAMLARRRRLGLSKLISTGNEGDVDLAEAIQFLVDDPQTRLLICYCETARDGQALTDALAEARSAGKPVVMIKAGRSEAGRAAALSHTGALAGADRVCDAVLRQYGSVRVDSLAEAVDIAYVASHATPPGRLARLGIVTISGGAGVMMADEASALGLALPQPSKSASARLAELVPYANAANPLDTTAQAVNELEVWAGCVETMLDGTYDAVIMYLAYFGESDRMFEPILAAMEPIVRATSVPVICCSLHSPKNAAKAEADDLLMFDDPSGALRAIAGWSAMLAIGTARAMPKSPSKDLPLPVDLAFPRGSDALNEVEAGRLLEHAGIATAPNRHVSSAEEAATALEVVGTPAVLKIVSADLAHKSDIGGVRLSLRSAGEMSDAYRRMMDEVATARPEARLEGAIVARQMAGGVELILGSQLDPTFGTVIMLGAGGVLAELFDDVVFRRAPVCEEDANAMIASLKVSTLLDGYRGAPASDRQVLARTVVDFSALALSIAGEAVIEINPLLVTDAGCTALDVLVQRHNASDQS